MRTKSVLTLDDAKKMMAAAEAEATRNKWDIVVAILDDGAHLVGLHRMDRARPGNPRRRAKLSWVWAMRRTLQCHKIGGRCQRAIH